jgi:ArsR family transcriptional regulator
MKKTMSHGSCQMLGAFFATFGHSTRMKIFCSLQGAPKTVTEVAADAGITITNASQHLRIMRDRGAVHAEKRAQCVYYHIADPRFVEAAMLIHDALFEQLMQEAAQAADRPQRRKLSSILQPA